MKFCILVLSLLSLCAVGVGIIFSMRSQLFTLQEVQVVSSIDNPPLDDLAIMKLAGISVDMGKRGPSLFDLDLKKIESRLLMNDLIEGVSLQKRPPRTLVVSINYRIPKAVIQNPKGSLSYVDSEGKIFSNLNLVSAPDLPVLMGFSSQDPQRIRDALTILNHWENSLLGSVALISSIHWKIDRGFRVLAAYSLGGKSLTGNSDFNGRARTLVEVGDPSSKNFDLKLFQLAKVFRYLGVNAIASRHIWVDAGKKIVVKTAHGS